MAFAVDVAGSAADFLAGLNSSERQAAVAGIEWLRLDPLPDGHDKVELPFPYRPGTLGAKFGDFWFAYVLRSGRLCVIAIDWAPDSPRHWSKCS